MPKKSDKDHFILDISLSNFLFLSRIINISFTSSSDNFIPLLNHSCLVILPLLSNIITHGPQSRCFLPLYQNSMSVILLLLYSIVLGCSLLCLYSVNISFSYMNSTLLYLFFKLYVIFLYKKILLIFLTGILIFFTTNMSL